MVQNIGPGMSVVEVFLQHSGIDLSWRKSFAKHALRLMQILSSSDASETKMNVVIIAKILSQEQLFIPSKSVFFVFLLR